MPKTKAQFSTQKIRKRKAALPVSRLQRLKKLIHGWNFKRKFAALAIAVLGVATLNQYQQNGFHYFFNADILQTPPPFDGTVFPVDKVPNWTKWKGNNATDLFSSIDPSMLIALPDYDISKMQTPNESLVWGDAAHDEIRNMKITYPVVYLGNYELDHQENAGSHLAVDIKMPSGTPVKNIANGRVVKVSMSESGFGHHVVVQHDNVPSLADPNKKVTLYSGFNHMGDIFVSQGQIVKKGQVIGESGNTGTSTTPHLHFQIDTASAPWHPYWPFSWQESQQAGLSFFEAVNAGLGMEAAKANTIHPMLYVKKYLNYSGANTPAPDPTPVPDNPPAEEPAPSPTPLPQPEPADTADGVDTSLLNFNLNSEQVGFVNNSVVVKASLSPEVLSQIPQSAEVVAAISGAGQTSKQYFKADDFANGYVTFNVKSAQAGLVTVEMGKAVQQINFIEEAKPISALKIVSDGSYMRNQAEELSLVALDDQGQPTPVANFFGVITVTAKEGEAQFEPKELRSADFKNGVAKVQMTVADSKRVIVRAQQGAIVGESDSLYMSSSTGFKDVPKSHPNYVAIMALEESGVINGYPDGTFHPNDPVIRVEALKMLMLAFNVQSGETTELPFTDTDEEAWYAKTLATAYHKAIVKGYEDGSFKPGQVVNIAELFKMLFETTGIEAPTDLKANPYDDVSRNAWYAGYAYLLNKKNLMEVEDNRLNASQGMARKDVAEAIYRLKYILDNNLLTYTDTN